MFYDSINEYIFLCGEKVVLEDGFMSFKREIKDCIKKRTGFQSEFKELKMKNVKLYGTIQN